MWDFAGCITLSASCLVIIASTHLREHTVSIACCARHNWCSWLELRPITGRAFIDSCILNYLLSTVNWVKKVYLIVNVKIFSFSFSSTWAWGCFWIFLIVHWKETLELFKQVVIRLWLFLILAPKIAPEGLRKRIETSLEIGTCLVLFMGAHASPVIFLSFLVISQCLIRPKQCESNRYLHTRWFQRISPLQTVLCWYQDGTALQA